MPNTLSPERYFLMYAFPTLDSCARVSMQDKKILETIFNNGDSPKKQELEKLFPKAFVRIKTFAIRLGIQEWWSPETIKEYWLGEHNRIIDARENGYANVPENIREACKVHFVRYDEKMSIKIPPYLNIKQGDFITIHQFQAIEKISEEVFEKYGKK